MFHLAPYTDSDLAALLDLWERALPLDAISREEFETRVLLDANREPESLTLARETPGGPPVGFILRLILRQPIERTGFLENRGFITAFGVLPEARGRGAGAALLEDTERFFRERKRKEIALAPYTPNYFVPGVDKSRYAEGLAFLTRRGFREFSEAIAMDAMIGTFEIAPAILEKERKLREEGIHIEPFRRDRLLAYMDFMESSMHGPWIEDARRTVREIVAGRAPEDSIWIAREGARVVGYCQFIGEHFGPFGVIDEMQGRGLGSVLLARTLYTMRVRGHHAAFVLWTGERAAQGVYGRLGFTISRRFALLKKDLA